MQTKLVEVGRLAMRHEGDVWNAYYARTDTMKGAVWLGSLSMNLARRPKHKEAFMQMMRDVVSDLLNDRIGAMPVWKKPRDAPDSERKR